MTHPWEAEIVVDPELALKIVGEEFPSLRAEKIELLGAGWDNTAYLINDRFVFRFPRREVAVPLLEIEGCILPQLAPKLPVLIPNPEWRGRFTIGKHTWPYFGYRLLPGNTACSISLSEQERGALAAPIAHFLAVLHAIPLSLGDECGLPGDHLKKANSGILIPALVKNLEELASLKLIKGLQRFISIIGSAETYKQPENSAIIHGDFYVRHLLVDERHRLAGIIDWGDIHIGDPSVDLAIAHSFLPKSAHDNFRSAYGHISEASWKLARLRALYSSSVLSIYGHHSQDRDLLREGLQSLYQIVQ